MKKIKIFSIVILSLLIFQTTFSFGSAMMMKSVSSKKEYTLTPKDNTIIIKASQAINKYIKSKNSSKYTKEKFVDALAKLRDTKYSSNERMTFIINKVITLLSGDETVNVVNDIFKDNDNENNKSTKLIITCNSNQTLVGNICVENKSVNKINTQECLDTKSSLEQVAQKIKGDTNIGNVYWNSLNARKEALSKSGKSYTAIEADPLVITLNIDIEKIKQNLLDSKKIYNEGNAALFKVCNMKASDLFCDSNEHIEGDKCVASSKSCNFPNGIGMQFWNNGAWGVCQNTAPSCPEGYENKDGKCFLKTDLIICNASQHKEGGICISNSKSCVGTNGNGNQTWNGNSWGSCILNTCYTGYEVKNGSCIIKEIPVISQPTNTGSINNKNPVCNTADIVIGTQTWSACNVGASSPQESGNYYMWGNNTNYSSNQTPGIWNWQNTEKGPCSDGYHIPSPYEWKTALQENVYSWIKLKQKLLITLNGSYNNGILSGNGVNGWYWTNYPVFGADSLIRSYGISFSSNYTANSEYTSIDLGWSQPKTMGFSVRCIKNN